MLNKWYTTMFLVFIGAGTGGLLRFSINYLCQNTWAWSMPIATIIANILGCFFMGIFLHVIPSWSNAIFTYHQWQGLLVVGFLGGLTTFSRFIFELHEMITRSLYTQLILYLVAQLGLGLLMFALGWWLARCLSF